MNDGKMESEIPQNETLFSQDHREDGAPSLSSLNRALASLKDSQSLLAKGNFPTSCLGLMLANLYMESPNRPIFVLCTTNDAASKLLANTKFFLSKGLGEGCEFFPGWDHSPYLGYSTSIKNQTRRARVLSRLLEGKCKMVFASVLGAATRTAPRSSIAGRQISISLGEEIPPEDLGLLLEECGYSRQEIVEDVGTYCIRGGILDLYSPNQPLPLRIDFMGDEMESFRFFDPRSQTSIPSTS